MKKTISILMCMLLLMASNVMAKSYKFDINRSYEVQIVRVAQQGTKFLKVWAVAGSVDKAIVQAKQDAVAACVFTGVEGNEIAGNIPALTKGRADYEKHKDFFDKFFKKGAFLNYVKSVNSEYPTGENNVATEEGRKVGIYVVVMYDNLRALLEKEGITKSLKDYF